MIRTQELGLDGDVGAMANDARNVYVGTGSQLARVAKGMGNTQMAIAASITLLDSGFKDITAIAIGTGGTHLFVIMHRIHDGAFVLRKHVAETLEYTGEEYEYETTDGVPYAMAIDGKDGSVYSGHSTMPGRVLKVSQEGGMVLEKRAILWAGEDDVRWIELDDTHVYANCKTSPGKIVKLERTELARQRATDLPAGANDPLAGCVSGGFVYAASSTVPTVVAKYDTDELVLVQSKELNGMEMVVAMECGKDYLYTASFTQQAYVSRIRKADLGQQSWVSMSEGGRPGMAAVLSAGPNGHLYVGTNSGPGVVYKVTGFDVPSSGLAEVEAP